MLPEEKYRIVADILATIDSIARREGVSVSLVGGVVRDILVYRDAGAFMEDIDLVVEGDARLIAREVAPHLSGNVELFDRFFTAKISRANFPSEIDLVSARHERYECPGALPTVSMGTLHQDLQRRDFTINAMALPLEPMIAYLRGEVAAEALSSEILDPLGGRDDLSAKIIRILHPQSFTDDPTRLFRAIRYGARLGASFCPLTDASFYDGIAKGDRERISANRVFQEVRKLSLEREPGVAFEQAIKSGILSHFLGVERARAEEISRAGDRIAVLRNELGSTKWWQTVQWLLIWAGMDRSPRIELALERRRKDIATIYSEVDFARENRGELIKSNAGVIAWYGLTGEGVDRVAALRTN
jgi:tRNA nucleotidyltransferase/poly(A) polymerase